MSTETLESAHNNEPTVDRRDVYVSQLELEPFSPVVFSTDYHLSSAYEMNELIGVDLPLVAGIRAGGKELLVLDTQLEDMDYPFMLVDGDFHLATNPKEYKALRDGQKILLGRNHPGRFTFPDTTSGDHLSIEYSEVARGIIITDLASTNGTSVTGYTDSDTANEVQARFTSAFNDHLLNNHRDVYGLQDDEAPYGYFRNHPIIGRESTSVRNGVYGTSGSECVVVDNKSSLVQDETALFMDQLKGNGTRTLPYINILKAAEHYTAKKMRYDLVAVERMSRPHFDNNGLILMSQYLKEGVGVCRHQALFAAHLIEEAISDGLLAGGVGVERNYVTEVGGAHAWAVFRPLSQGEEVIIDPAQHFVGTRKQADAQGKWKYRLSDVDDSRTLG